jgi:Flp pilus assembly protein TadG
MPARWSDEDGVIASQLAVLMPALLVLLMLAVQFGLWAHASQLARAAADEAAYIAALPDASEQAGRAAAVGLLTQAGNLGAVTITVDRQPDTVIATVSGVAPQVVPGFGWSVSATAAAPVERFIPQESR